MYTRVIVKKNGKYCIKLSSKRKEIYLKMWKSCRKQWENSVCEKIVDQTTKKRKIRLCWWEKKSNYLLQCRIVIWWHEQSVWTNLLTNALYYAGRTLTSGNNQSLYVYVSSFTKMAYGTQKWLTAESELGPNLFCRMQHLSANCTVYPGDLGE